MHTGVGIIQHSGIRFPTCLVLSENFGIYELAVAIEMASYLDIFSTAVLTNFTSVTGVHCFYSHSSLVFRLSTVNAASDEQRKPFNILTVLNK